MYLSCDTICTIQNFQKKHHTIPVLVRLFWAFLHCSRTLYWGKAHSYGPTATTKTVFHVNRLTDIYATHSEMEVIVAVIPCEHPHRDKLNLLPVSIPVEFVVVLCKWAFTGRKKSRIWRRMWNSPRSRV